MKIMMIATFVCIGFGQGIQPLLGYAMGSNDHKQFSEIMKFSFIFSILLSTVITTLSYVGLNQIVGMYNELWIIDHEITTEEAKGEAGDLLYRWGNEQTYSEDGIGEQILYFQHYAYWIDDKAGDIQVYNNGSGRVLEEGQDGYTEIIRLTLPVSETGEWDMDTDVEITWCFNENGGTSNFYSMFMGGSRMLPNGNTIAISAADNRINEINQEGEVIMDYIVPLPGRGMRVDKISPDYPGLKFED